MSQFNSRKKIDIQEFFPEKILVSFFDDTTIMVSGARHGLPPCHLKRNRTLDIWSILTCLYSGRTTWRMRIVNLHLHDEATTVSPTYHRDLCPEAFCEIKWFYKYQSYRGEGGDFSCLSFAKFLFFTQDVWQELIDCCILPRSSKY